MREVSQSASWDDERGLVSITRAGDEGTRAGDEGTRAGDEGTRAGDEGTRAGDEGTRAGDEGTRAGDEGTRAGDEGTRAGEKGGMDLGLQPARLMSPGPAGWALGPPADGRAPNRILLEGTGGHWKLPTRVRSRLQDKHLVIAVGDFFIGAFLLIAAVLIGGGLLMVHFGVHDRLGQWDEHVNQWFAGHRASVWNRLSGDFTVLADTVGVLSVAAVVTLWLLLRHWGRLAWLLGAGLAVELSVFLATNYVVDRPRPKVAHLGSTPSTSSWPSGHVAATAVLYGGIAVLVMVATSRRLPRLAAWTAAVGLTIGVALSRIYRGEHHPTDTIAGFCLGGAALGAAILVIQVWTRRAGRAAPAGSPPTLAGSRSGPR